MIRKPSPEQLNKYRLIYDAFRQGETKRKLAIKYRMSEKDILFAIAYVVSIVKPCLDTGRAHEV